MGGGVNDVFGPKRPSNRATGRYFSFPQAVVPDGRENCYGAASHCKRKTVARAYGG